MKHIFRTIVLAVALVTGLTTVSAQSIQVVVIQKTPTLPTAATNYLDDPFRYFTIQYIVTGAPSEGLDVFFDMDFTLDNSSFYLRTKKNDPTPPSTRIHVTEGVNSLRSDELRDHLRGRKEMYPPISQVALNAQLLPEGTYELCMDVYLWGDWERVNKISNDMCPSFEMCYSGSAPELVSPMAGAHMALNGAMVVAPARKINFFWSPVISNCTDNTARFKYMLKVVKVLNGQNYRDAIKYNPTVFSAEVRNNTYAVFDTLRDIKVHMEKGALYVAQVHGERINTGRSTETFIVANDGNSQPMPFYWCYAPTSYSYYVDDEAEEGDDSEGVEGVTLWEGGVEEVSELDGILEKAFPDDQTIVLNPKRHYVESDGYYTIPNTNDLEVGFIPARHKALKNTSYTIELYDYLSEGIDSTTANKPLLVEEIKEVPESSSELITRTLAGWGANLEQGSLYYLQLSRAFTANYWNYSIADTVFYVNEIPAQHIHDTITRDFLEEEMEYADGVIFQWGDDPEAPSFTTPQWKAPVDRTGADIYDPANYTIPATVPEVKKAPTFPVSWAPVKNVTKGDVVEYEVNVYELKSGQTLEEAVSENPVLVTRTVTDAHEISASDTKFFKVFSAKKTYVMTLSTTVDGDSETIYHFENGNEALPIIFKIVK